MTREPGRRWRRRPRDPYDVAPIVRPPAARVEVREEEVVSRRWPGDNPWFWFALLGVLVLAGLAAWLLVRAVDDDEPTVTVVAASAVPRVVGLAQDDAVARLEGAGFDARVVHAAANAPAGTVVRQRPAAGTRLGPGEIVALTVSSGEAATVTVVATVADVRNLDHIAAGAEVDEARLVADTYPVTSSAPRGIVLAQSPDPGVAVAPGEHVRRDVSLGPRERPPATVPDVTGPEAAVARATLRELGLTVRTVERAAPTAEEVGEVILQQPAAGTSVPALTQVTIFVGR